MSHAVLIVEDEATLARNIALFLGRHGYDARIAGSAEDALTELESFRPDAVVLDFNLPGMDGLVLLRQLLGNDPNLRIVMTTGHGSEQVAVDAMKAGAYDYLTKPLVLSKLKLVLDKALGESRREQVLSYYQERTANAGRLDRLVGDSPAMRTLRETLRRLLDAEAALVQGTPPALLIDGETGTGKELVARAMHFDGLRAAHPFVELNCASIPAQLLEAELFGFERGAFTDARNRKLGLIESAEGGTLFLDEIGEMDAALQAKLLRFLENKTVRRIGSVRDQYADVRIVAATNRNLDELVRDARFRADLLFRLRIMHVSLPPLRARAGDVAQLTRHFLKWHAQRYGQQPPEIESDALARLERHDWPGNVRELSNCIEQAVVLSRGSAIRAEHLNLGSASSPPVASAAPGEHAAHGLMEVERRTLLEALERNRWNVTQAARALGISRDTLRYRIEKHRLKMTPPV